MSKQAEETVAKIKADDNRTRGPAIHAFCLECIGYSYAELNNCSNKTCALYPFRKGHVKEDE